MTSEPFRCEGGKKYEPGGFFLGKDVLAAAAIRHVQRASVSVVKINCQEKRALQYMVFVFGIRHLNQSTHKEGTLREAFKSNFWKFLGFCPN